MSEILRSGTDGSNGGSKRSTSRRNRIFKWAFGMALGVVLVSIVWMELGAWRRLATIETTFSSVNPDGFLVGLRLREGMERLTSSLLRFQLSGDPVESERFRGVTLELSTYLANPPVLTPGEHEIIDESARLLQIFLRTTDDLSRNPARSIRKDTPSKIHQTIQAAAVPVFEIADELAARQETVAREFFAGSERSIKGLRSWLVASLGLMLAATGVIAVSVHSTFITPLHDRISASLETIGRHEHLAALGTMAAGVVHEIRNPLAALKFRLFSLKKSLPPTHAESGDLAVIHNELLRLDRILEDFSTFARPAQPEVKMLNPERLAADVRDLLSDQFRERNVRVELHADSDVEVAADRDLLQQVFINLMQNAADAMADGGTIGISIRRGVTRSRRKSQPVVNIEISDTGPGLPPDAERNIFDPFFSTKEGGTGLGLSIAARIIESHRGEIRVSTQPGRGTTFSIMLPYLQDEGSANSDH